MGEKGAQGYPVPVLVQGFQHGLRKPPVALKRWEKTCFSQAIFRGLRASWLRSIRKGFQHVPSETSLWHSMGGTPK